MTDKFAEIGTPLSHYAGADKGPFNCHSCAHFKFPKMCDHPKVIADAKNGAGDLRLQKNGMAIVDLGGCCSYFR